MRRYSFLLVACAVLLAFSTMMSSCKKHHEDPVKPKLSFTEATKTVKESDGTIDITMTLDQPSPEAISITYELDGTAVDKVNAGANGAYDYEITSDYLETKIKKGETTGTISIKLYSDLSVEDDETIQISIKGVDSDNIEITREDDEKITVTQEDGLGIFLAWGVGTGEHYTDVDMDLFLWGEDDNATLVNTGFGATTPGFTSPELFFMPSAPFSDGNYGLSCNYYEGTADPMNFEVTFVTLINGTEGTPVKRTGTYSKANINPWDDAVKGNDPLLVQTFKKSGSNYSDFSEIDVPDTLSRVAVSHNLVSRFNIKKGDLHVFGANDLKLKFHK